MYVINCNGDKHVAKLYTKLSPSSRGIKVVYNKRYIYIKI